MGTMKRAPKRRTPKKKAPLKKTTTPKTVTRALGRAYLIDAAWKAEIGRIMAERGLSQAGLAREIDAWPSALVFMFKENTRSSTMVPAIHRALGLVPPSLPVVTTAIQAA